MEEKVEYKNIFQLNGYESREDYLQSLSEEYNVPLEVVEELAEILGTEELFDGLVSSLEDVEDMFDYYGEL